MEMLLTPEVLKAISWIQEHKAIIIAVVVIIAIICIVKKAIKIAISLVICSLLAGTVQSYAQSFLDSNNINLTKEGISATIMGTNYSVKFSELQDLKIDEDSDGNKTLRIIFKDGTEQKIPLDMLSNISDKAEEMKEKVAEMAK